MTSDAGAGGDVDADTNRNANQTVDTLENGEFAVSSDGTVLVTLHEGTDTTARSEATAQVTDALEGLAANGTLGDWSVGDATVYEPPTAPFDPYTVSVTVSATVVVSASDAETAETIGTDAIDAAFESAGIDEMRDASSSVTRL